MLFWQDRAVVAMAVFVRVLVGVCTRIRLQDETVRSSRRRLRRHEKDSSCRLGFLFDHEASAAPPRRPCRKSPWPSWVCTGRRTGPLGAGGVKISSNRSPLLERSGSTAECGPRNRDRRAAFSVVKRRSDDCKARSRSRVCGHSSSRLVRPRGNDEHGHYDEENQRDDPLALVAPRGGSDAMFPRFLSLTTDG